MLYNAIYILFNNFNRKNKLKKKELFLRRHIKVKILIIELGTEMIKRYASIFITIFLDRKFVRYEMLMNGKRRHLHIKLSKKRQKILINKMLDNCSYENSNIFSCISNVRN